MMNHSPKKFISLIAIMFCLVLCVACGDTKESKVNNSVQSQEKEVVQESKQPTEQQSIQNTEPNKDEQPVVSGSEKEDGIIKKLKGASDDTGIYSIAITLSTNIADKGEIEMIYQGAKGSPQENSVVNTFLIKYYKEESGTYEVNSFFDGEVYQNYHHQEQIKLTNTFSANLRAGNVTIYYTPDGGERQEIYYADADQFR